MRTKEQLFISCRLLVGCLFLVSSTVWGDFEDLGSSARTISMGGAAVAIADDSQNVFINPAGLGFLRRSELSSDYGRLFMGLEDNSDFALHHFAVGIPLVKRQRQSLAEHIGYLPTPITLPNVQISTGTSIFKGQDIDEKENLQAILSGKKQITKLSRRGAMAIFYRKFSLSDAYEESTLGLGWGRAISQKWNVGLSIKQLEEKYAQDQYTQMDPVFNYGGNGSVSALSFDMGTIVNIYPKVFMGLSILDLLEPDVGLKEAQKIPRTIKLGLGYRNPRLLGAFDWTKRDNQWTMGSGIERYLKNQRVALRAGFMFGSGNLLNLNMGGGVLLNKIRLDYAFQYPLNGILETFGTHRFSLIFKFGQPAADMAEPGSLEQAYLKIRDELVAAQEKLTNLTDHRNSLEKVLVEEATQRIQERIEAERRIARERQAAAARKAAAGKKKPKFKKHKVRKGDTLQSLANQYYGDRSEWRLIYDANKSVMGRGGALKKGITVIIPPLETSGKSRKKAERDKRKAGVAGKTHKVKEGESLKSIAKEHYGDETYWKKIYKVNKDKIIRGVPTPGSELLIPK